MPVARLRCCRTGITWRRRARHRALRRLDRRGLAGGHHARLRPRRGHRHREPPGRCRPLRHRARRSGRCGRRTAEHGSRAVSGHDRCGGDADYRGGRDRCRGDRDVAGDGHGLGSARGAKPRQRRAAGRVGLHRARVARRGHAGGQTVGNQKIVVRCPAGSLPANACDPRLAAWPRYHDRFPLPSGRRRGSGRCLGPRVHRHEPGRRHGGARQPCRRSDPNGLRRARRHRRRCTLLRRAAFRSAGAGQRCAGDTASAAGQSSGPDRVDLRTGRGNGARRRATGQRADAAGRSRERRLRHVLPSSIPPRWTIPTSRPARCATPWALATG